MTWKLFRHVAASIGRKGCYGKSFSQRVGNCVRPEMSVIINLTSWTIASSREQSLDNCKYKTNKKQYLMRVSVSCINILPFSSTPHYFPGVYSSPAGNDIQGTHILAVYSLIPDSLS